MISRDKRCFRKCDKKETDLESSKKYEIRSKFVRTNYVANEQKNKC